MTAPRPEIVVWVSRVSSSSCRPSSITFWRLPPVRCLARTVSAHIGSVRQSSSPGALFSACSHVSCVAESTYEARLASSGGLGKSRTSLPRTVKFPPPFLSRLRSELSSETVKGSRYTNDLRPTACEALAWPDAAWDAVLYGWSANTARGVNPTFLKKLVDARRQVADLGKIAARVPAWRTAK